METLLQQLLNNSGSRLAFFTTSLLNNDLIKTEKAHIELTGKHIGGKDMLNGLRAVEYPLVSLILKQAAEKPLEILDIGTKNNPLPWHCKLLNWTVSDTRKLYYEQWDKWSKISGKGVRKRLVNATSITLNKETMDVYLSISVIEHIPDKESVFDEAARVLKKGGLAIITFDWIDKALGMKWPHTGGGPIDITQFMNLISKNPYFEQVALLNETTDQDVNDFHHWHKSLNPVHYDYSGGIMLLRRNNTSYKHDKSHPSQRLFEALTSHALRVEWIGMYKGILLNLFPSLEKYRKKQ